MLRSLEAAKVVWTLFLYTVCAERTTWSGQYLWLSSCNAWLRAGVDAGEVLALALAVPCSYGTIIPLYQFRKIGRRASTGWVGGGSRVCWRARAGEAVAL